MMGWDGMPLFSIVWDRLDWMRSVVRRTDGMGVGADGMGDGMDGHTYRQADGMGW